MKEFPLTQRGRGPSLGDLEIGTEKLFGGSGKDWERLRLIGALSALGEEGGVGSPTKLVSDGGDTLR